MAGLADRAAGVVVASSDLAVWHDLQRWIALGPDDAVVPFAKQITDKIEPLMVRFRRDVGSLFSFIKTSAILHQAQREVDAQGRVIDNRRLRLGLPNLHEGDGGVVRQEHSGQRACGCEADLRARQRGSRKANGSEISASR
jgi:hypothetical protein